MHVSSRSFISLFIVFDRSLGLFIVTSVSRKRVLVKQFREVAESGELHLPSAIGGHGALVQLH
jgi:hypothetical protein